jgi:hypothetical protein
VIGLAHNLGLVLVDTHSGSLPMTATDGVTNSYLTTWDTIAIPLQRVRDQI